jgi:hypothetical protein
VKEDVKYSKINRIVFELIEAAGCERGTASQPPAAVKKLTVFRHDIDRITVKYGI